MPRQSYLERRTKTITQRPHFLFASGLLLSFAFGWLPLRDRQRPAATMPSATEKMATSAPAIVIYQ